MIGNMTEENESFGPVLGLTLFGIGMIGTELYIQQVKAAPVARMTVIREPGSEEESGIGSGMSSLVGPGRTPPNWRNGPNIFGG